MNTENREDLQQLIGDDYQLQWVIGHGGMSTVWLADDVVNEREVALKVLRPEFSSNQEFLARFRNEALAAEGINSPNVVATYDYREVTSPAGFSMCFIAMEYIRGESLADLIAREGQLEESVALDVLEQAAHGLAMIHRMGMVHRDIKPGNLMITQNGQIKITDFGIAKAAAAVPLTRTGMVVGTAQYVSPEQAQGLSVTPASDVYSLSVVGYEMLSGRRPFTGDSSVSVALAHVSNEPPALPISVSAPTRELIEIGLRKNPEQRFRDGNEMQLAVSQVRNGMRPAQPGGRTQVIAAEPSATASTQMLANVADARTTRPAGKYPPSAAMAVQDKARRAAAEQAAREQAEAQRAAQAAPARTDTGKSSAAGPIIAALLLLALIGGGVAWAWSAGMIGGSSARTTTPMAPTTAATATVTETQTQVQQPQPEPREVPTQDAPGTITFEPETSQPSTTKTRQQPTQEQPHPSTPHQPTQPQSSQPTQPQPTQPTQPQQPDQPPASSAQEAPTTPQDNGELESQADPSVTGGDN
ncbi:serine/threonine-protein kinase [Corynebacterium sp. HMSC29G08]|uniref:serine/threonine-protein kinase n=1 Tax=Corynebacterium sp. HMSC29G08 TaxID=1581069 RepID=UPI0008A19368|nr:serine/threonine-protein kinase [Corynebacterium sp. HMSC29G08]OFT84008.1 serine/threonine protein kinase [Corynebacterium sp. HMSC29G08]